ncbi:MAG: hypothetical protein IIX14_05370 [Clostridia bacterium]|nr:hypothetical protein [Clostridia bacterium]
MKRSVFSRKAKNSSSRRVLRNRLGMTYVELLTALGLLALIITSFTPMLLSSYETLYDAGVKVQDVYDSKQELEEGLARRDSENTAAIELDMRVNADALFESVHTSGRKVISTFQEGLETVFGQIRARIEIVSPSTVYDNKTNHDIVLQTFGMEYNKITFGTFPYDTTNEPGAANKMPSDQIHIQVIAPNKSARKTSGTADENMLGTEDELVYSTGRFCELEYYRTKFTSTNIPSSGLKISNDDNAGRIKLKIKSPASGDPLDFTYSPLKIKVYYMNSRGHLKTVSEYLYIDPATLVMAGETASTIDYYTSAGIEAIDISTSDDPDDQKIEYRLSAEARKMRISNSPYLANAGQRNEPAIGAPSASQTEIRSIRWIANDETQGLNPYYVMTGTNGSIYRMYCFTSDKPDIFDYSIGARIYDKSTGFFSTEQEYIDRVYTTTTGKKVFPALWGGDFAHIFEYTSAVKRVSYGPSANNSGSDETWATSATYNGVERAGRTGDPAYNVMSANAQFCYYYNGAGTAHKFGYKDAKPISYILTERGWPIRLYGVIGPADPDKDYFEDFVALWDRNQTTANIRTDTAYGNSAETLAFHYKNQNDEQQSDYVYGGIRIKALASYPINKNMRDTREDYFDTADDNKYTTSMTKLKNVQKQSEDLLNGYGNDVNVTDVIYIPGTDTTQGSTFYVGKVHAYANIIQTDKLESGAALHHQKKTEGSIFNKKDPIEQNGAVGRWYRNASTTLNGNACSYPRGAITDYLIISNKDGTATYICKHNDNDYSRRAEWEGDYSGNPDSAGNPIGRGYQFCFAVDYINRYDPGISYNNTGGLASGQTAHSRAAFFLPNQANAWEYLYMEDVSFTFGFASNRERVYTNITYDGQVEYTRSFERLYWRSHYGQDATYYKENGELNFSEFRANQAAYSGADLSIHQQNRAVSDGNGGLQTSQQYLNSVDNDYYNVWFPGEMYNLNKIASKDGVTVAVGYAVAGSTYQHSRPNDNSVTSTALGSIYNDGVLAAMIEGKDSAFVNLLYFKDNESFDNYSLYDPTSNVGTDYSQYSAYGNVKYGTHSRDSVQFTAVDLIVENVKASETARDYTVNYYAYYGDSKGRVFRSLVASASGTSTGNEGEMDAAEAGASLVPYISDTPTQIQTLDAGSPSQMVEIVINGKGLDEYFSKIVTIDAMDDLVIITGEMRNGGQEYFVVGTKDTANNWTWRTVRNCGFTSIINDATIVGGYYYIVGDGWLAGVSLDVLRDVGVSSLHTPDLVQSAAGCHSEDPTALLWCGTSVDLYAIAGRDTQ